MKLNDLQYIVCQVQNDLGVHFDPSCLKKELPFRYTTPLPLPPPLPPPPLPFSFISPKDQLHSFMCDYLHCLEHWSLCLHSIRHRILNLSMVVPHILLSSLFVSLHILFISSCYLSLMLCYLFTLRSVRDVKQFIKDGDPGISLSQISLLILLLILYSSSFSLLFLFYVFQVTEDQCR